MKKVCKYLFVFFAGLLVTPAITHAECGYERQAELSRIAANVQVGYSYQMENNYPIFTVNITNVTNDIYIDESVNGQRIINISEATMNYKGDNLNISFNIYSNDQNCPNEKLLTKYINIPKYNFLSTSDECKKYPNFKYCGVWLNTTTTLNQFNVALKEYVDLNSANNNAPEYTFWESATMFFKENKVPVIIVLIVMALLIATVVYKKHRREF